MTHDEIINDVYKELMKKFTFNSKGELISEHDAENFPTMVELSEVKQIIRDFFKDYLTS